MCAVCVRESPGSVHILAVGPPTEPFRSNGSARWPRTGARFAPGNQKAVRDFTTSVYRLLHLRRGKSYPVRSGNQAAEHNDLIGG